MIIDISENNLNVIERGIYYLGLLDYPNITASDLANIIAFIKYEKSYGRQTEIKCQDEKILKAINDAISHPDTFENVLLCPDKAFVYHGTDLRAAKKILSSGRLLSAVNVYEKTGEELSFKKSDSLWNDPPDFFEYIMFCWGDNMTGDFVVLSGDFPSEDDLLKGNFNAGVRFYFKYEDMLKHPDYVLDGYHAIKVKDEIILFDYLYACIVPEQYKAELVGLVPPQLLSKVHFLSQRGISISSWNKEVYDYLTKL